MMKRMLRGLFGVLLFLYPFFPTVADDHVASTGQGSSWAADGAGFENVVDPAAEFLGSEEMRSLLRNPSAGSAQGTQKLHVVEHRIPFGPGKFIHATEYFTPQAYLRSPRRAVLLLHGPESNGDFWALPDPIYNGPELIAGEGMFAFTVDLVGVHESFIPGSGEKIRWQDSVEPMASVIRYVRHARQVPQVDLLGESIGGNVAVALAADAERVRSCIMSAMLIEDLLIDFIVSPPFYEFLINQPDGYLFNSPDFYLGVLSRIRDEKIRDYVFESQAGFYPTGPFLALFDGPPYFDPSVARAPGLLIAGTDDEVAGPGDPIKIAAEYGGQFELTYITDGMHVPRLGPPEVAVDFWATVLEYLERD